MVDIRQDREVQKHTGGIVWETAFLLATFLEVSQPFETQHLGRLQQHCCSSLIPLVLTRGRRRPRDGQADHHNTYRG
jgi:hypothetical protein